MAPTTVEWVKGHCEDQLCNGEEEVHHDPTWLYTGWTNKVEQSVLVYQGERCWLKQHNRAKHTLLATCTNGYVHKEIMGRVLRLGERGKQTWTLPEPMRRDLLLMMGNTFPVYKVVARNSGGTV